MSKLTVKELLEVNDSVGGNPVMLTTSEGFVFEMPDSVFQVVCLKWADQLVVDMDEQPAYPRAMQARLGVRQAGAVEHQYYPLSGAFALIVPLIEIGQTRNWICFLLMTPESINNC